MYSPRTRYMLYSARYVEIMIVLCNNTIVTFNYWWFLLLWLAEEAKLVTMTYLGVNYTLNQTFHGPVFSECYKVHDIAAKERRFLVTVKETPVPVSQVKYDDSKQFVTHRYPTPHVELSKGSINYVTCHDMSSFFWLPFSHISSSGQNKLN